MYNTKGIDSKMAELTCGVPQGSVLGPLLFVIYINDIHASSKVFSFTLFADDTNKFYKNRSLNQLLTINNELKKLSAWFKANKLSLNISKTNYNQTLRQSIMLFMLIQCAYCTLHTCLLFRFWIPTSDNSQS